MILTVDIGNTTISWRMFKKTRVVKKGVCTHAQFSQRGLPLRLYRGKMTTSIISSVVPFLTRAVKKEIHVRCGVRSFVVGQDLDVRIPHAHVNLKTLGSDRLVNIYGALFIYKTPFLVIDFGSAITFDVVDADEVYHGGVIVPGVETSFNALKAKGALLPKTLSLSTSRSVVGKNTKSALIAGALFGFAALTDGMIERYQELFSDKLIAVATGGTAKKIIPLCQRKITLDLDLTHKALVKIAQISGI